MNLRVEALEPLKFYSEGIARFVDHLYAPEFDQNLYPALRDTLSRGQYLSKMHLLEHLVSRQIKLGHTLFIGHWHGLLPFLLLKARLATTAVGIEQSNYWYRFAMQMNSDLPWKGIEGDATHLPSDFFYQERFDSVVNCSCEHMSNAWLRNIPKGTRVFAQANDFAIPEHTHLQESLETFCLYLNLTQTYLKDTMDCKIYQRFTVFGVR